MIAEKEVYGNFLEILTDRLRVRKLRESDAGDIFHYASDPEVTKYVLFPTHQTMDDTWKFLKPTLEKYDKGELAPWGLAWKLTDKLIGTCDFIWWDHVHQKAEIGYILEKEYWNRGIMTEAICKLIQFGFEKMELNRIEAKCHENNIASARVMEKVGMKWEGLLREEIFAKGSFWNLKHYSILKKEWKP